MSKNGKILLFIGSGLLLLAVVCVVGGYFTANYMEARLEESVRPAKAEGVSFGKNVDQQSCILEGLRRGKSSSLTDPSLAVNAFTEECLKAAKPTPNFCDGVPSYWSMQDNKWKVEQCRKSGHDEIRTGCTQVFMAKHRFCSPA